MYSGWAEDLFTRGTAHRLVLSSSPNPDEEVGLPFNKSGLHLIAKRMVPIAAESYTNMLRGANSPYFPDLEDLEKDIVGK